MQAPQNLNLNDMAERLLTGAERLVADAERMVGDRAQKHAELPPADTTFQDALRERTARAIATPALIAVNVAVFFMMAFRADGPMADPKTILEWGGSFGPRTTNGEWWRIVTSIFIHTGLIQLVVHMAGLAQAGLLVERLVGRVAVVTTYLAAGMVGVLLTISEQPLAISSGSSAAVFGIYGLLLASFFGGLIHPHPQASRCTRSSRCASRGHLRSVQPGIRRAASRRAEHGVRVRQRAGDRHQPRQARAGPGRPRGRGRGRRHRFPRYPLRGIADVRPEIARIAALEEKVMSSYEVAIDRFRKGRMQPEALAKFIEKDIMPDLAKARARLEASGACRRSIDRSSPTRWSTSSSARTASPCGPKPSASPAWRSSGRRKASKRLRVRRSRKSG